MEHEANKGKIKYAKRNSELTKTNKIKMNYFLLLKMK